MHDKRTSRPTCCPLCCLLCYLLCRFGEALPAKGGDWEVTLELRALDHCRRCQDLSLLPFHQATNDLQCIGLERCGQDILIRRI